MFRLLGHVFQGLECKLRNSLRSIRNFANIGPSLLVVGSDKLVHAVIAGVADDASREAEQHEGLALPGRWRRVNHRPGLDSVDEAIRRPFCLVPFTVTIAAKNRDLKVAERVKTESSLILQWLIEGCLEWQMIGLAPPKSVIRATDKYLTDEYTIASWITDRRTRDKSAWGSGV